MYAETDNDRDDVFIVNINCSELHFDEREFAAITGLKYGDESDFVEDSNTRNKLIDVYFNTTNSVNKTEFIRVFKEKDLKTEKYLVNDEDVFNMIMLYFINTFLLSSPSNRSVISKLHFELVKSGEYVKYSWGSLCFNKWRKSISHQLKDDPSYVKFGGFSLALQIWFYECSSKVPPSIVIRIDILFINHGYSIGEYPRK
ncbi:hypothetical protein P3S68_011753 [Capsicum galapagoense]